MVLTGGLAYPALVTGIAQLVTPASANGSLVTGPNGTVVGSSLVGQNLSLPWLFWERPSPTDYNAFNGTPAPPGPGDPALVNETLSYLAQYRNFTVNGTSASLPGNLSLWLLTPSASGTDPDLPPADVLIQIPRVHAAIAADLGRNVSEEELRALVNAHLSPSVAMLPSDQYVNVLLLDIALVGLVGG
jgi:K+-transporting ATPase ATPase C chain